jgi:AcrR family transcriptional regulator
MPELPVPRSTVLIKQAAALPRPSRMRAAERKKHLIAVAVRLFATRGFSGTTTKAIAEAGGVSEAIIFRHFKGKEDLYGAILREKARQDGYDQMMEVLKGFARRNDDEQLVFHLVLRTLESFENDRDFHRLMLHAALERPDLAKVSRRILGVPLFKFLRSYVARRQKVGAFCKGHPKLLAFGIVALPMHFGMVTKVLGVKRVNASSRQLAAAFTRIILDGLHVHRARSETAIMEAMAQEKTEPVLRGKLRRAGAQSN